MSVELGPDTADAAQIRPFWAALLDYDTIGAWGEIQLSDATGRWRAVDGNAAPAYWGARRPAGQPRVPDHLAGPRAARGA